MKALSLFFSLSMVATVFAQPIPAVFQGLFTPDVPVRGQIGMVRPPAEIDKYIAKVEDASRKHAEWFEQHAKQAKPGVPLPYDERLGLTRAEYDEYLALWAKREFKTLEEVMLVLRKGSGDTWTIAATGPASLLTTLRYDPAADVFRSPNGELKRLEDIKTDPHSVLGAWSGREWRFEEESSLLKLKENIAIGRMESGAHGLIVYRAQELSSEGTRLLDKNLVIRFPIETQPGKGAETTKQAESGATPAKDTTPPAKKTKK